MNKPTAKPFVKWVGGKGKLLPTLEKMLPADIARRDSLTYIEPFVGGGVHLVFLLHKYGDVRTAVINDTSTLWENQSKPVQHKTARIN